MKLQFKSITRKADSDKHIAMIRKELSIEDNAQCKAMGEDYIRLIKDVGSREALTRRFFLIYQYEAIGRSESDDYSKSTACWSARSKMHALISCSAEITSSSPKIPIRR